MSVFAGRDFETDEVSRHDFVAEGYRRGVPMSGDLTVAPQGKAPTFMVRVLRDPDGPNLDRVQVIKGWLDEKGETHDRIYDVAVSDGRAVGADGRQGSPEPRESLIHQDPRGLPRGAGIPFGCFMQVFVPFRMNHLCL